MRKSGKALSALLLCVTLFCVSCGTADQAAETETKETASVQEAVGEVESETETETETTVETVKEEVEVIQEQVIDRAETFAFLEGITAGWNLGNSLDAYGGGDTNDAELAWSNPKTTQEMIDAVMDKGFNLIRIPITWAEHVGPAPEYQIRPEWMARVKEVVDYAYLKGAYVIIDTHHEEYDWMSTDTSDPQKAKEVEEKLVAIWTQIAKAFQDYDERLMFEGMNEPRMVGSWYEWSGGTAKERALVNEWNQAFVDAVRATGGNNENRILLICPYATSASPLALKDLQIPADNHIVVAVHMYTPYEFTYVQQDENKDKVVWDGYGKADIESTVKLLKSLFLEQDVPVMITEYGAINKGNVEEIEKWLVDFLTPMEQEGIKTIWWDNGIYDREGEKFAIFNRQACTWYEETIADTILSITQ